MQLPKFEMFEEGEQIRRSSKSVSTNIVEGWALRNYKSEFLHYLYRSYSECCETREHLDYLYESNSLKDEKLYLYLAEEYENLCSKIYAFISSVEKIHRSKK